MLRLHPTFHINPDGQIHHPMVLLHASAREHFHALVVAVLKTSDCCHNELVLLTRVLNLMSASHNTIDFHIGLLAAGILLGNASISGFPISAAIAACVISDEDVARLVTSSEDRFQSGRVEEEKHSWQGDSVQYNLVTTLTSISEPGGHSPDGEKVVGSLLTDKLSEASRARHTETFRQNSHWPEQIDNA